MLTTDIQTKPLLYGRLQAAARLNVSVRTLDDLLATKQLRSVKIGKRRLVSEDAIQAFIRKSEK
jgi:excisionase family DNA binding protein